MASKNIIRVLSFIIFVASVFIYFIKNEINTNQILNYVNQSFSSNNLTDLTPKLINASSHYVEKLENNNTNLSYNFGEEIHPNISLRFIKNAILSEESEHLLKLAENLFIRSETKALNGTDVQIAGRTSQSAYLHKFKNDTIISGIIKRLCNYLNNTVTPENFEGLQVVKYEPGNFYRGHHDFFKHETIEKLGQRKYTFFGYLNDDFEGGETEFPKLKIKIKPVKGALAFWVNCITERDCYDESLHGGLPPTKGIKYGLNIWIKFPKNK